MRTSWVLWLRIPYLASAICGCGLAIGLELSTYSSDYGKALGGPAEQIAYHAESLPMWLAALALMTSALLLRRINTVVIKRREARPSNPSSRQTGSSPARQRVTRTQRWRRWIARHLDYLLWAVLLDLGLLLLSPDAEAWLFDGESALSGWVAPALIAIVGIVPEALLISALGCTPGKWILGIRVVGGSSERLSFRTALWRSLNVCSNGVGFNLPFVGVATMWRAWRDLESVGACRWESSSTTQYTSPRILAAANVTALAFAATMVGTIVLEAEDESMTVVRSEIAAAGDLVRTYYKDRGWSIDAGTPVAFFSLENNSVRKDTIHLLHGGSVAIVAGCDSGCEDLDLQIFDPFGTSVGIDSDADDRPMVVFNPSVTGDYEIVTMMHRCTAASCNFGFTAMRSEFAISDSEEPSIGYGTGFAIDSKGRIMTANHVVEDAESIVVVFGDGRKVDAVVERQSPANDLAIIRVAETTEAFLSIAEFPTTTVGQEIFVVGFPDPEVMGEEIKFTNGSVTALSGMGGDAGQLQFSAPIQPGNSGSPVVTYDGHVVGVVTSTAAREGAQLVNWATKGAIARAVSGAQPEDWTAVTRQNAIDRAREATVLIVVR